MWPRDSSTAGDCVAGLRLLQRQRGEAGERVGQLSRGTTGSIADQMPATETGSPSSVADGVLISTSTAAATFLAALRSCGSVLFQPRPSRSGTEATDANGAGSAALTAASSRLRWAAMAACRSAGSVDSSSSSIP